VLRAAENLPVGAAVAAALTAALGGAFYPGQRLAIGLVLTVLLAGWGLQRRRSPLQPEEWVALAFLGWGVVAAAAGAAPLAAKEVLAGWLVAWWLWTTARRASPRAGALAMTILAAAGFLVAAGVAAEALVLGSFRVGGLLESPNVAAALLVSTLPLVAMLLPDRRRGPALAVGAVLVVAIALTGSRAGLLALLATGVAVLPNGRARIAGLLTGATAVAALVAWRFASAPEVLAWFRPAIWLAVLRLWAVQPLAGVGPGGLGDAAGPVRLLHADHVGHHPFLITYAESSPLGLLVQAGAVGFLLAAAALLIWLRRGAREGFLSSPPARSLLAAIAVMAAFHDFVTIEVVLWWWAVALGLIEAATRRGEARPELEVSGEPRPAATLRALLLALVVLWSIVQPAWARWLWQAGPRTAVSAARAHAAEPWLSEPLDWRLRALLAEERWAWERAAEALALGREAVRVHPGASRLWLNLGQSWYRTATELGPWPDAVAGARDAFARATALEPLQPWAWLEWARLERGLGRLDEAAALARRAAAAEPNAVRVQLFLARVELDRGNLEQARAALRQAQAASAMRARAGLTAYERELVETPGWQLRELEEALR
jgi:hypothetical protein